jgi:hypothetical protein
MQNTLVRKNAERTALFIVGFIIEDLELFQTDSFQYSMTNLPHFPPTSSSLSLQLSTYIVLLVLFNVHPY